MPDSDGARANGCVSGSAPCGSGEICREEEKACIPDDCEEPDRDGDGHARIGCGDGDDCDDDDPNRFPGNPEVCDPFGHDEDCNSDTITGDPDRDGDGHIDAACWNVREDGTENRGTDCDDTRNTVHPDAPEVCNGIDDDCDGVIDEGVQLTFYRDVDGDGYGVSDDTVLGCTAPLGYVLTPGDCDDTNRSIHPGASEVCNGIDDDCDGTIDPGCACEHNATQPCGIAVGECTVGTQTCVSGIWSECNGRGPVTESCNGLDDDCDGEIDEGLTVACYPDADGDGYTPGGEPIQLCSCTGPTTPRPPSEGVDCDDSSSNINPAGVEVCDHRRSLRSPRQ